MANDTYVDEPLIQECSGCGATMDVTNTEPLSAVTCAVCGTPATVSPMIDHFELLDILGRGGMGAVYKAYDTSLERMVALKLVKKGNGTAEQIKQLETEAAITAAINHPHVVRVFMTGMDHGRFYIAMELVENGPLEQLVELQGRAPEAQVLEVGMQIASGLRAAQEAGLIHRDVKPGNILFADAHTAKIVDFGLAIFAEDEAKVRGEIWGTPYYVAPEKLDKRPEDFRSDIYSLGATLFHALAGRPPFEAENASMVALKHLERQAVSLQTFAPHVSSNTNYVINRMLNKDPDQRYQSYGELIEHFEYALNELLAGRGKVQEKRLVLESERQKKAMGWLTFGMAGLLVLLIGAGGYLRNRILSGSPKGITKEGSALIADGLHELVGHKSTDAVTALAAVAAQKPGQPWLNWADMLTGLAQFDAGNRAEGIAAFQRVDRRGPYSKEDGDKGLDHFFVETAEQMTSEHVIDPKATNPQAGVGQAAALFYGMKDWQAGAVDEAAEFFRRFRQAKFVGPDSWLEDLKPMATEYVVDHTAYQMALDAWKTAKTPDQKRKAVEALKAVQGRLASKAQELALSAAGEVARLEKERAALLVQGKIPDDRYKLTNRKTGTSIDVEGRSHDDGHRVHLWRYVRGGNQQWHIIPQDDGSYMLVNLESAKALSLPTNPNAFNPHSTSMPKPVTDDGTQAQQSNVNKGVPWQRWKIEKVNNTYFKLISQYDGKALTAKGPGDGAALIQAPVSDDQEQQWKIEAP